MGVKHLWNILGPFCERKPLYELQGKTVAVDLSCWICEAQNIAEYQIQPRMYLRNLYFRTCYLLLMEVQPVFVLEGKAPELKYDTIAARNAIQFKGAKPKTDKVKTGKDRSRFHFVLKQCEEMLGYMGIACIKGNGEAESLCAYLNEDGLVDGCISQDSDCFAYGAKVVYRNFSISQQGAHAGTGGAVDVYDIRKVDEKLDFGRNKIVAMALLLGSDYSDGVHGVGKDSVEKFFEFVSDAEVLDRLRNWRSNHDLFKSHEEKLNDKNICTSCGHYGKIQAHTKNGCMSCSTTKGCDPLRFKDERLRIKNEVNMRNKSIQDPDFPNEKLISEFLTRKDNVSSLNLKWKQPDLVRFVKFASKFLGWEEIYSFEKLLPILTRWQILNKSKLEETKGYLVPDRIKKVRNPKSIPSYEIIWTDPKEFFKGLIPEDQLSNQDIEKLYSTIEPQILVEKAYIQLVEDFKASKIKPKKVSKRKQKKLDEAIEEIDGLLKNTSITEPVAKKTRKPRQQKKKTSVKDLEDSLSELTIEKKKPLVKTLDSFLKKAVLNNQQQKNKDDEVVYDLDNSIANKYQSTPCKGETKKNVSFDLNMSNFGDEDDTDVSDLIDDIIRRKRPLEIDNCGENKINTSSFFTINVSGEDLFEKNFNAKSDDEKEDTDDSFNELYVPLYERLKQRNL